MDCPNLHIAGLVRRGDAGAVRGHLAGVATVLPSPVAGNDNKTLITGRPLAARVLIDHGRFPLSLSNRYSGPGQASGYDCS